MQEYFNEVPYSVTICDKDGKILYMNEMAVNVLSHGQQIIGNNLLDCHPEPARTKLAEMLQNHNVNAYTIEKTVSRSSSIRHPGFRTASLPVTLSSQCPSRWRCRTMCEWRNEN